MVDSDLLVIYSFLQVFGKFPVFRKLTFKSIEEWLESSSTTGGNFQHCLHLLLGKQPQHKSFLTKLLEFCNYSLGNGTFRARQLHNCPVSLKLKILLALLERQLVMNKQLKKFLNCGSERLRVRPVGQDKHGGIYMLFVDRDSDVRIYYLKAEDDEGWTLLAKDKDSFERLITSLEEQIQLEDVTNAINRLDDTINSSTLDGSLTPRALKKHEDSVPDSPSDDEMFECKSCKRKMSNTLFSETSFEFHPVHWTRIDPTCSICKHRVLIDCLEEKFLIYSESLDKFMTMNPEAQSYHLPEATNEKPVFLEEPPPSDEVTSSNMAISESSPKEIEPEESLVSDALCENIPELCVPSPVYEVLVDNPVVDDVPSSPSECEDNEIKDPSFEFNLYEHTDDDDDIEVEEEAVLPNSRKKLKKEKIKKTQCSKNKPRTNKNGRLASPWKQTTAGKKQRSSGKATRTKNWQSFTNLRTTSSTTSGLIPSFNSFQMNPSTPQRRLTNRKSQSFSDSGQSTSSHYNYQVRGFGPTSFENGSKISRIGNSTSFMGRLAGSGNASASSFLSEGPYCNKTSLDATPSKSFSSYGSEGFGDDLLESEFYDECTDAGGEEDDWAWDDYDETCEYENYDPGELDDDIDECEEGQEEAYTEFSNDLVILDKDGEESYATHAWQDAENRDVVQVLSSDGERYEEDCQDSQNDSYYHDNYADDDTAVEDLLEEDVEAQEENYDYGEDYEDECQGHHDYDKSLDVTEGSHREDLDHFYEVKEEFHGQQTPEDDCFVVEVIE